MDVIPSNVLEALNSPQNDASKAWMLAQAERMVAECKRQLDYWQSIVDQFK